MEGWADFCVAQVGASAALAGLVFVGVSINLTKIMGIPQLVDIALEAMLVLVTVLGECSILLAPHQPPTRVGGEIVAFSIGLWLGLSFLQRHIYLQTPAVHRRDHWPHFGASQVALLAFIASGIWLLVDGEAGLILYLPATLLCYTAALSDAWVLLIEINR